MMLRVIKISTFVLTILLMVSCASSPKFTRNKSKRAAAEKTNQPKTRYSKNNNSEKAKNENADVFYNLPGSLETVTGYASYYADDFDGKQTANGETFNMYELTAAHRTYPFNTMIRVTNLANNKTVIVRINDRGPVPEDRIIDLSLGAAMQLDMLNSGIQKVQLDVIEWGK
ncbi:Rare lipoprotein A precursor [hydrothermal vent metagenome]|uniref:Rare lipoprotein A n=1 Tax=hydrothermal vent metagenome TaxID=652676 RepID=A0A3B1BQS2_9ZZZZ